MTLGDYVRKIAFIGSISFLSVLGANIIIPNTEVYAQEKKKTLEDKLISTIDNLEKKEEKTDADYVRLIDLYFNFKLNKEKILSIISEAEKSVIKGTPELDYLHATSLKLNKNLKDMLVLKKKILENKKSNARLKSNSILRFNCNFFENSLLDENDYVKAIELDKTNLQAYKGLFKLFEQQIMEFPKMDTESFNVQRLKENKQLEKLMSAKFKKMYNQALKQPDKFPDKAIHLDSIHNSFANILKTAFTLLRSPYRSRKIELKEKMTDKELKELFAKSDVRELYEKLQKNYFKLADKCYKSLLRLEPSIKNYMNKGIFNLFFTKDTHGYLDSKGCSEAYKNFDKAHRIAKKEKDILNIKGTLYYKGLSLFKKAKAIDTFDWKECKLSSSQRRCVKESLKIFEELEKYEKSYRNSKRIIAELKEKYKR